MSVVSVGAGASCMPAAVGCKGRLRHGTVSMAVPARIALGVAISWEWLIVVFLVETFADWATFSALKSVAGSFVAAAGVFARTEFDAAADEQL